MKRTLAGLIAALAFAVGPASVLAASPPANLNLSDLGVCGSSTTSFSDILQHVTLSGDVYVRLTNNAAPTSTSVYFQSFNDGMCHLIGTVQAQAGQWTKVGTYSGMTNDSGSLVVNATGLGAAPYAAVAQVLFLPDPALCIPVQTCNVTYQGYSGTLQPQILSTAADQINVYMAQPIANVPYTKVGYYADSQYLYGATVLRPLNHNYLSGGSHNTVTQVSFKNGETLSIDQTINMGLDITSLYFFRSLYYRSHDKALLIALVAAGVIILSLIGWVIGLIRRHRASIRDHGFAHISSEQWANPDDTRKP